MFPNHQECDRSFFLAVVLYGSFTVGTGPERRKPKSTVESYTLPCGLRGAVTVTFSCYSVTTEVRYPECFAPLKDCLTIEGFRKDLESGCHSCRRKLSTKPDHWPYLPLFAPREVAKSSSIRKMNGRGGGDRNDKYLNKVCALNALQLPPPVSRNKRNKMTDLLDNPCRDSPAPKAACTVSIVFKPTSSCPRVAALTFVENTLISQQYGTLTGTGK
jgi:hypothetical protein